MRAFHFASSLVHIYFVCILLCLHYSVLCHAPYTLLLCAINLSAFNIVGQRVFVCRCEWRRLLFGFSFVFVILCLSVLASFDLPVCVPHCSCSGIFVVALYVCCWASLFSPIIRCFFICSSHILADFVFSYSPIIDVKGRVETGILRRVKLTRILGGSFECTHQQGRGSGIVGEQKEVKVAFRLQLFYLGLALDVGWNNAKGRSFCEQSPAFEGYKEISWNMGFKQ